MKPCTPSLHVGVMQYREVHRCLVQHTVALTLLRAISRSGSQEMAYLAYMQLESPLPRSRELQMIPFWATWIQNSQEANCSLLDSTMWYGRCVYQHFEGSYRLHLQGKMQTVCFCITLPIYQTTWCHNQNEQNTNSLRLTVQSFRRSSQTNGDKGNIWKYENISLDWRAHKMYCAVRIWITFLPIIKILSLYSVNEKATFQTACVRL
jgi:hypothetical protein